MECDLDRISTENGDFVVYGKIRNVSVREDLIDENGKIDYEKASLITYNSIDQSYHVIGECVAKAFSVGLKKR
jgi:flavin reductase (DIM6/NTAB) family NADH-FMN oxidoreductase RutF